MTQQELANQCGVSLPLISQMTNGRRLPRPYFIKMCAAALHTDPKELMIRAAKDHGYEID